MQSIPQTEAKTGKILEIDGARALSIIFVLLVHITYGRLPGGFLGVDIFFVVSGYLITMLLLREHATDGSISLRNFYARRVLRILPALAFACALAVILPNQSSAGVSEARRVLAALFFHSNFLSPEEMGNLAHTWSLSIEEQFYLVGPLS